MENKDQNRLKVVLAEEKRTNKWLAEQLGNDPATVSKWCTNVAQPNWERFVELLVKIGDCKAFRLVTKPGDTTEESNLINKTLKQLKDTLADMESNTMEFDYEFDENTHDRYIRTSNNWDITLGRGLHIYQDLNPEKGKRNYFQMGTYDLALRPCMKTRIIFTKRNAEE